MALSGFSSYLHDRLRGVDNRGLEDQEPAVTQDTAAIAPPVDPEPVASVAEVASVDTRQLGNCGSCRFWWDGKVPNAHTPRVPISECRIRIQLGTNAMPYQPRTTSKIECFEHQPGPRPVAACGVCRFWLDEGQSGQPTDKGRCRIRAPNQRVEGHEFTVTTRDFFCGDGVPLSPIELAALLTLPVADPNAKPMLER